MPTPSISLPAGRVCRSADSHVRDTPSGSWYVILREGKPPSAHAATGGVRYLTSFVHRDSFSFLGSLSSEHTHGTEQQSYQRLRGENFGRAGHSGEALEVGKAGCEEALRSGRS